MTNEQYHSSGNEKNRRIPVTIIGGYLGAGKTTLVNHILRENENRRLAIIVNDFGDVNIDADLIEKEGGDTIELSNGCICCSLGDSLSQTLYSLIKRNDSPEHIIIEASGVADPEKVSQFGSRRHLVFDGIIVVADGENIRQQANDKYTGELIEKQIISADLVIINKSDLLEAEELRSLQEWLSEIIPETNTLVAEKCQVPIKKLIDENLSGNIDSPTEMADKTGIDLNSLHDNKYDSWTFQIEEPVNKNSIQKFVDELPNSVIRGKGVINIKQKSGQSHIFQLVGERWSISSRKESAEEPPHSTLVLISHSNTIKKQVVEDLIKKIF